MLAIWRFYRDQSFMLKMSVGFILGAIVGIIFGPSAQVLAPFGDLLLRLLNMIVLPLILFTLIGAVNNVNPAKLGRVGVKVFFYYIFSTAIAIILGLVFALLINPGTGLTLPNEEVVVPETPSFMDTLLQIVPNNIFASLTNGDILGVIFVAIITGFTISSMAHGKDEKVKDLGKTLFKVVDGITELTIRILNGVLQYAPIGIFAIGATAIGGQGLGTLASLGKLTGAVYIAIIVQILIVYVLLLQISKVNSFQFFKDIKEATATAFMTTSSLGTLPVTMKAASKAGIDDDIASFSLPMGATVNMDGAAIRLGASVVFAANIVGLDLGFSAILGIVVTGTLASVGTAGVPGAGLIALSIVLTQAGLPIEVVALVAGVDVILGMGATACNVIGDLTGAKIVDQSEKRKRQRGDVQLAVGK